MAVLDRFVKELVDKKHFLTSSNISDLQSILPSPSDSSMDSTDVLDSDQIEGSDLIQLSTTLRKLIKMSDRMYKQAVMSDDPDEQKKAAASLKQSLDVAIKYADKIKASDRAIKVENALIAALNTFCEKEQLPDLKEEFLSHLKEELGA